MIVLDTNVFSEPLRPVPSEAVMQWLHALPRSEVFITTVTQAEVLYGIEILPAGNRRSRLSDTIENIFENTYCDRVLPFDHASARVYAKIAAQRRSLGRAVPQLDLMIAAICASRGATLATRNTADFEHCGIPLVNPWKP